MAQVAALAERPDRTDRNFKDFCGDIFNTLSRIDQRRAGETYLYGLLNCPGRKSIRRMATVTPGYQSEQSLQQFVNQSPWDHETIRQRLMDRLVRRVQPIAWVIEEIAFPKHGRYSAAVERQYVRSLEKVCNCQLATVVTLTNKEYSIPVNWRLVIPESWGEDHERRARARIPEHERPRPVWQYQIEVLDDMALDWGMPVAPVVLDARHVTSVDALLTAIEDRGLPYLARVSPNLNVGYVVDQPRLIGGAPIPTAGPRTTSWAGTVNQLVRRVADQARTNVSWRDIDGDRSLRSQFLQLAVRPLATEPGRPTPTILPVERRLIVEWPLGKPQPRGFWITNLGAPPLADLVGLAKLSLQVGPRLDGFARQFGLRDYEGRTFTGWHHHVTLVTAAYVYHVLNTLDARGNEVESVA